VPIAPIMVSIMAKALVKLPVGVILPGMPESLQCEGATVAEALADCVAQEPRLQKRIFRPDGTPWVGVSVNGRRSSLPSLKATRSG
jgi:hypothetical protein